MRKNKEIKMKVIVVMPAVIGWLVNSVSLALLVPRQNFVNPAPRVVITQFTTYCFAKFALYHLSRSSCHYQSHTGSPKAFHLAHKNCNKMASSSSAAAAVPTTHKAFDILDLKAKVYDESVRLTEEDDKVVFHQPDILEMEFMNEVAALDKKESINVLLDIVNKLLAEKLYKIVQDGEGMGWRVRSREEAKRFVFFFATFTTGM
jgi:hypothetical protein